VRVGDCKRGQVAASEGGWLSVRVGVLGEMIIRGFLSVMRNFSHEGVLLGGCQRGPGDTAALCAAEIAWGWPCPCAWCLHAAVWPWGKMWDMITSCVCKIVLFACAHACPFGFQGLLGVFCFEQCLCVRVCVQACHVLGCSCAGWPQNTSLVGCGSLQLDARQFATTCSLPDALEWSEPGAQALYRSSDPSLSGPMECPQALLRSFGALMQGGHACVHAYNHVL